MSVALHYDAVVVGSGAGGAVVAAGLAERGARVVLLEEGRAVPAGELTGSPRDMLRELYRDAGQLVALGRPPVVLPTGVAVGGTTLVNSGTCLRTPDRVLARWRAERGLEALTPEAMAPLFDRVEAVLGVARVTPELAGGNARVLRRGAEALGWSGGHLRRNARGCRGSGVCAFGCPTGAKQHVGETYVPRAVAAGAVLRTGLRARRVIVRRRRATGVEATDAGGRALRFLAPIVVVAAGTLQTPRLLAASGLGRGSGRLGRGLTVHPATAALAELGEVVDMGRGVPQSYGVDEFAADGLMLEAIAGPPAYVAGALPATGARHRELMLRYRHLAQMGLMVADTGRGRVALHGRRPLVRYALHPIDARLIRDGLAHLVELFAAAGARRVLLPIATLPEVPATPAAAARVRALDVRPSDLKPMGFHPLGTAAAHADPARGVVDPDLAVHGVAGVHVADGSAVPGPLGVNPQITIMALATRLAEHLTCPS